MRQLLSIVFYCIIFSNAIAQKTATRGEAPNKTFNTTGITGSPKKPETPDVIWGKLFADVQLSRALSDNKTFVDAVPKYAPSVILQKYQSGQQLKDSASLRDFVYQNFRVPAPGNLKLPEKTSSLKKHLEELWPALTRKADVIETNSSLLPLPKAYVVPGGRFREIYYWDSYFTMQGLAASKRYDLIENMLVFDRYLWPHS